MLIEDLSIGRVTRREPVSMRLSQRSVGYRFTHVVRFAASLSPEAQTISGRA
jgi:hypothetical protein